MSSSEIESEKYNSSDLGAEKPAKEPTWKPRLSNLDSVLSTKTPDKSASLPGGSRKSGFSLSLQDVRQMDETDLRRSEGRTSESKPVKRQILASPRKSESPVRLPERFEILAEFFNGLETAIRLLKLRGYPTTFANILPKIECLTHRRFSNGDLAQMKHIFPEAIEIKRVLKYDEKTCCMKPDLVITLNINAVLHDEPNCASNNLALRKIFRSRLVNFYRSHPKGDIPEELLPEPFNPSKTCNTLLKESIDESLVLDRHGLSGSAVSSTNADEKQHLSEETINTSPLSEIKSRDIEECISHPESKIPATPIKDSLNSSSKGMASTPVQNTSTPVRLMSATPTLRPSRRCSTIMSPDDDDSAESPDKLVRRPSRTRSLKFDSLEEDEKGGDNISDKPDTEEKSSGNETDDHEEEEDDDDGDDSHEFSDASDSDDEEEDILPESLLQLIKNRERPDNLKSETSIQQRGLISGLLKLFDLIHFLFQSTRRAFITKDELLYRIIAGQSNITDRNEAEQQLSLMIKLVPGWISEIKAASGDLLIRMNKVSATDAMRARLKEAIEDEM